jgi:uncharacterized protein YggE
MAAPCRRTLLVAALLAVASRSDVVAQARDDSPPTIRVTGHATITTEPDQVIVDVGVVTRAASSALAASENADLAQKVLDAMRKRMSKELTLRTVGYSVWPEYTHPKEGRSPRITGYLASNVVRAETSQLDRLGVLIDAAVAAGANRIDRIEFTLANEARASAQALREAATRARSEADALAAALGLRIVRVLSAAEASTPVRPMIAGLQTSRLVADAAATPVESGTIDIQASVSLTVEVAGRQSDARSQRIPR